jgi:hypothetical protein
MRIGPRHSRVTGETSDKLVQRETESDALRLFLRQHRDDRRVTSALARVEVVRAILDGGPAALAHARRQLARVDEITLDSDLLDTAATIAPGERPQSLDATHLAARRRSLPICEPSSPMTSTRPQPATHSA